MGRVQDVVRAPLVPLADALRASVRDVLAQASLLS
jgi:hypothetical protein